MSKVVELKPEYTARPKEIHEYPPILQAKHIGELLGIGTTKAYEVLHMQGCPTLKLGKRLVAPRDKFWEFLMTRAEDQSNQRLW